MWSLISKEFRSFFSSLLGFTVVAMFLLFTGLFLWIFPGGWNILDGEQASLEAFFSLAPWVMMFLVPAITMRSFADEHRVGTLELLLTQPLMKFRLYWQIHGSGPCRLRRYFQPFLSFGSLENWVCLRTDQSHLGLLCGSLGLSGALTAIGVDQTRLVASLRVFLSLLFLKPWNFYLETWNITFLVGNERHWTPCASDCWTWVMFSISVHGYVWCACNHMVFQRHSLSEGGKAICSQLEEDVIVTCYLTGDLPKEWRHLENEIGSFLEQLSRESGGRIQYQFVDIYDDDNDEESIGNKESELRNRGLTFTRLNYERGGQRVAQNLWPGLMIASRGEEVPINLVRSGVTFERAPLELIQSVVNGLEWDLISGIRRVSTPDEQLKTIGFLEGHGEPDDLKLLELFFDLERNHRVVRLNLDKYIYRLNAQKETGIPSLASAVDLVVVAKPTEKFKDIELVLLDEYIMNGGRILWMLDPISAEMEKLNEASQQDEGVMDTPSTFGVQNDVGLSELLYHFGVKVNRDLVLDPQCSEILVNAGPRGGSPQLRDWVYFPTAIPDGTEHAITTNLAKRHLHFQFVSSLDLVDTQDDVAATVLLHSSEKAKRMRAPVRIALNRVDMGDDYFDRGNTPNMAYAVLLEGSFNSRYSLKAQGEWLAGGNYSNREKSPTTAMMVISDGDFGCNKVNARGDNFLSMNADENTGDERFSNREFLLNSIHYLLGEKELMSVGSRTILLRPLNMERVKDERTSWQFVAVGLPLMIVSVLAMIVLLGRKAWFGVRYNPF